MNLFIWKIYSYTEHLLEIKKRHYYVKCTDLKMIQAFRIVIILDYYFLKNWGAKMWQLLHVTQGAERGGLPNPKNQVVNTIFLVQWPHDRCAWRKGLNKNSECEVKTLRGRRGNWGQVTSTDAIHLAFCLCIRIHLGPSFSTFCLSGIPPPSPDCCPLPYLSPDRPTQAFWERLRHRRTSSWIP